MKKDITTTYCLRCGLRYFKDKIMFVLPWCQCPDGELKSDELTNVPYGSVFISQEQKL